MVGRKIEKERLLRAKESEYSEFVAVYVTTFGLKRNAYANNVQSQVTLADLFASA